MTATIDPSLAADPDVDEEVDAAPPGSDVPPEIDETADLDEAAEAPEAEVRTPLVAAAAAIAGLTGVWLVSRLFRGGVTPFAVGALGLAVGIAPTILSYRLRRPTAAQALVLPAALALGAILATTAGGSGGSVPTLIGDAISAGGLSQPPIPFEPGWRFIVTVLFALVGAASCATATSFARPKLAVALSLPITAGAALLQPPGSEVLVSGVAVVGLVAGLAVAFGADLASDGVVGGGFEIRRLARGALLTAVVVAALFGLARTDLLFPATDRDEVIPPRRPPSPPPQRDRVLFTVDSDLPGPWRVGVLDVYEDNAFLLPSVDPARLLQVDRAGGVGLPQSARPTFEAKFGIADGQGQTLPGAPNPVAIRGIDDDVEYDPRTQVFKLTDRSVPDGLTYTVVAAVPPGGRELAEAAPPPQALLTEFTSAPPTPPEVAALLTTAPEGPPVDRLQFVRQALYTEVVAAGAGRPVDVPAARVAAMLGGAEATPYEIVAAEVLLARWAGVPARIGFGFFGGEDGDGGVKEFRPKHGAAFLEAYFEGFGWVPIVGVPPKAKASLSDEERNEDPRVVPTDELALIVFVPVRSPTIRQLYEAVRYWAAVFVPIGIGGFVLLAGYPAALKAVRTFRRRRWGAARGGQARIAVAYAELRDRAFDLNIGDPRSSPIEFLASVADDDEHTELAWLVSRAIWGDLARDLRVEDVESAEELARSVRRRLMQEQTAVNRVLAGVARASLRDPWSDEVPNFWRSRRPRPVVVRHRGMSVRRLAASVGLQRPARLLVPAALAIVVAIVVRTADAKPSGSDDPATYPDRLVPATAGGLSVVRQTTVEGQYRAPGPRGIAREGRVFTLRGDDSIQGSFQVALLDRDIDISDRDVQDGIERGLGDGFRTNRIGIIRLRVLELAEQRLYLWFPPGRNVLQMWVMRKDFADGDTVVRSMIAHQRGLPEDEFSETGGGE